MAAQTSRNSRTITAYLAKLLEYPRWFIEREVDFTHCSQQGVFDAAVEDCANCPFGAGCVWLNQHRTPSAANAPFDELVTALDAAVLYVQTAARHARGCRCATCAWLRDARRFLRAWKK